jgi:glycine oxidase
MKVVIVGAGVAGLAIGWRLLQAAADVIVLERAQPGHGATWAAAGMISVVGESENTDPSELALARYSAALWPNFAREIEEGSDRGVSYRKDGKLVIAASEEAYKRLMARLADESDMSMLSAAQACALEPLLCPTIAGALWDPSEAQVDNRALGTALAQVFVRAGGQLLSNETVVQMETHGNRIRGARTPFGLHEGDAYVLAAGAWTSRIEGLPRGALPVIPIKGEMVALTGGIPPTRIVWGDDVYLVPRADRLLIGATASEDGFDTRPTDAAATGLLSRAATLMPALANWRIAEHWVGLRPGSPDGLPMLGHSVLDGLFVASGQFRNGILFAPAVAEAVAALVLAKCPTMDMAAFDPRRFSGAALAGANSPG